MDVIDEEIEELRDQIRKLEGKKTLLQDNIRSLAETNLVVKKEALTRITKDRLLTIADNRKRELAQLENKKTQAEFFLDVHQSIDTAPIKERCTQAEQMKSYIPLAKEVEALRQRLEAETITAQRYDHCVDTARLKPHELLTKVELPIKGLGVDGKGIVTINDLPLSNLSTSQQVRTCLDIARVLAKDNPLKLICVDKIEHLDETVRKEFLKQIGETEGFQFFVTEVTDGELKIETRR
jgi:hypothetical protein